MNSSSRSLSFTVIACLLLSACVVNGPDANQREIAWNPTHFLFDSYFLESGPATTLENGPFLTLPESNVTGVVERDSRPVFQRSATGGPRLETVYGDKGYIERIITGGQQLEYRYVMDINPAIVSIPAHREIVDDNQVLSLFYSNKSMQALLAGDISVAYAYTREAILTDATSAIAWNNLGVLYSRIDRLEAAGDAYRKAIELDEAAYSAKSNLARVYRRQGRLAESLALEATVQDYVNENPYYHQSLAEARLAEGDYQRARTHLEDAVSRKHNEFAFHHELAIINQKLGHTDQVIENLTHARRHARGAERARFSGKLKALQEIQELQASP
ncbi:MAG: tetratricopeptide repeat protein [Pseudohongiellaceae bacterium]